MLSCLVKTDRIETLKDRMLSVPRYASIEQAKIITDTYKAHEGEPRIMQRAYSLKNCLEKIGISVEPEELKPFQPDRRTSLMFMKKILNISEK